MVVPSLLATLLPPFPDLLRTLYVAVDLALGQIWARVTGFVVPTVSSIDDRTKNPIGLVHDLVGDAEITKRLRQGKVLGRHKMGGDHAALRVRLDRRVLGRHVGGISSRNRRAVHVGYTRTALASDTRFHGRSGGSAQPSYSPITIVVG